MPTFQLISKDGTDEWKTTTWNPTTGCDRISSGCDNCYALAFSSRLKGMGQPKYQNDGDPRTSGPGFDITMHPDTISIPKTWKKSRHIFVDSMSDLFHARVPEDYVKQVLDTISQTPQHTYQILTKRARRLMTLSEKIGLPDNLWIGTSIEDASQLHRLDDLRKVKASVKILSLEPLIGPLPKLNLEGIDWITVAGESGPNARKIEVDWVRDIRDQSVKSNIPFFFMNWGGSTPKGGGKILDGQTWNEMPLKWKGV